MRKSIVSFLAGILIVSTLVAPLHVSIYNPNAFPLTNASWTDNLIDVQPGLVIADPVGLEW